jgi:hypothetical protein
LILSGLSAGALYAASAGGSAEAPPEADPAAVDTYLAQLAETVPPPPAATLAARREQPKDSDQVKAAGRADRAEPVVGAAFSVIR